MYRMCRLGTKFKILIQPLIHTRKSGLLLKCIL